MPARLSTLAAHILRAAGDADASQASLPHSSTAPSAWTFVAAPPRDALQQVLDAAGLTVHV
ncbi:MAG: hypothetical protein AAB252_04745, partial [Pseudomonadota bacterium]